MATAANLPPVSEEVAVVRAEEAARIADKRNTRQGRAKLSAPLTGLLWLIVAIYALPLLWFLSARSNRAASCSVTRCP